MKKIYLYFIPAYTIFFLSSCVSTTPKYLHAPNGLNLLQTEKKNDFKAAVNYAATAHSLVVDGNGNADQTSNGVNLQTAYAVSNKIAIKADIYSYWERDESLNNSNPKYNFRLRYKRNSADFAIGYFNNNGKDNNISFNAFTGIGIGNNSFEGYYINDINLKNYKANYVKWFMMPSLTFKHDKYYSVSIGYKLSVLRFKNLITNDSTLQQGLYKNITNKNSVFGDFALDNKFSFKNMKGVSFHIILGVTSLYTRFTDFNTAPTNTAYEKDKYLYNDRFGAVGVILDINEIFSNPEK